MITIEDVSFRYNEGREKDGLTGVDLVVPDGQAILLCGESGSGKSTLTRLVNGLVPHFYEGDLTGRVTVDGMDVDSAELSDLTPHVGSVFQNPRSQFFTVDTDSELVFASENLGWDPEEILRRRDAVVRNFGIGDLRRRNLFHLSGGQKQQIACAAVSVHGPDILVLDEPSANLDAAATRTLHDALVTWKAQGRTIVVAEHRLHWLRDVVDRVVCLGGGRILADLTVEAFAALVPEERERLGLRPFDLEELREPRPATTQEHAFTMGKTTSGSESGETSMVVDGFRYVYGRRGEAVLDVAHDQVPLGRVTALVGPNGAGKSTFASCLCGLMRNPGTVTANGRTWGWRQRRGRCFLVMQDVDRQLFCESVLQEVLVSQPFEDRAEAERLLEDLDLSELSDRHPLSLSGGEKQRLAVACALAGQAPVVVLDEPTSGLDLRRMRQIAATCQDLAARGRTVVVVTHDPELVLAGCDHVLRPDGGSVVESYPLDAHGRARVLDFFEEARA